MSDKTYCYPPKFKVLINKFDYRDQASLTKAEKRYVRVRMEADEIPSGKFDLAHLQSIHKYLFQDVYEWAGGLRTVPLAKGDSHFMPPNRIETAMRDVHNRLEEQNYLRGMSHDNFAFVAGEVIGDVNYIHPFREGNGRTQLTYLGRLAEQAGFTFQAIKLGQKEWIKASIESHNANYERMGALIKAATQPIKQKQSETHRNKQRQ